MSPTFGRPFGVKEAEATGICRQAIILFFGLFLAPAVSWLRGSAKPKLIEGAKKEGQLVYYTTMTLDQSKQTVDRFEKKYPFKYIIENPKDYQDFDATVNGTWRFSN